MYVCVYARVRAGARTRVCVCPRVRVISVELKICAFKERVSA